LSKFIADTNFSAVNGRSADGSLETRKAYGNRIRIIDPPNSGRASARNAGVRVAVGDVVAFLYMDEYWRADKLAIFKCVVHHCGSSKPTFLLSDLVRDNCLMKELLTSHKDLNSWFLGPLELPSEFVAARVAGAEVAFRLMLRSYPVYPSSAVTPRRRLNHAQWPQVFKLCDDFMFNLRNTAVGSMAYIHQQLCVNTRHDSKLPLDERKMLVANIRVLRRSPCENAFPPESVPATRNAQAPNWSA